MAQSQQNLILSPLSKADLALLEPHLEPVDLPLRQVNVGTAFRLQADCD